MTEILESSSEYSASAQEQSTSSSKSKVKQYFANYASRNSKLDSTRDEDELETQISFGNVSAAPTNRPKLAWDDDIANSPSDRDYLIEEEANIRARAPLLAWRPPDSRHYGNCIPFLYVRGEPLCLVGPDCSSPSLPRAFQCRIAPRCPHPIFQHATSARPTFLACPHVHYLRIRQTRLSYRLGLPHCQKPRHHKPIQICDIFGRHPVVRLLTQNLLSVQLYSELVCGALRAVRLVFRGERPPLCVGEQVHRWRQQT